MKMVVGEPVSKELFDYVMQLKREVGKLTDNLGDEMFTYVDEQGNDVLVHFESAIPASSGRVTRCFSLINPEDTRDPIVQHLNEQRKRKKIIQWADAAFRSHPFDPPKELICSAIRYFEARQDYIRVGKIA